MLCDTFPRYPERLLVTRRRSRCLLQVRFADGGSGWAAPTVVLADGQLYGVPGGTRRVVLMRLKKLLTPTISTRALSCRSS
jgi:hypothetical protein